MYDFKPYKQTWAKSKTGRPATERQKKFLKDLGWDEMNYTVQGASTIIDAILNA